MLFKNLHLYRFTRPFALTAEQLEAELQHFPFTPCGSQDHSKFGWVPPLGKQGTALAHAGQGQLLICAKREEKLLPSAVVDDEVKETIEALELVEGRRLNKKERELIKEEVITSLLPRAFSRWQQTYAWINPEAGFIAVDASSARRAEEVLALLRKSIGSLPAVPLAITTPPEITLTDWLKEGTAPAGFALEDEAELRSALEHGGIIRAKQQDLLSEEVKSHLDADKLVTKLALNWSDTLSFVLADDMSIKRLKFSEELREQNDDMFEDAAARFDADFCLITGELSRFIDELIAALGGEEDFRNKQAIKLPTDDFRGEGDSLYQSAVAYVRESGRVSPIALQRHFKIGYNRAADLVDAMESHGIISKADSEGRRQVITQGAA